MGDIINRFMNFDKLIGAGLIKVIYFVGLALIVIGTLITMLSSLGALGSSPFAALGGFVIAPVFGVISILFWRFVCELYILLFRMSDDLRDIKNEKLGRTANETDI